MYFIPSRLYGVLDYLFGLLLISSPWLFGFANHGPETTIPVWTGVFLFVIALVTNVEWGLTKLLSFESHLMIDTLAGLFVAASPWLFGFVTNVYAPHLIIGLIAVFIVAVTKRGPVHRKITHIHKIRLREKHA